MFWLIPLGGLLKETEKGKTEVKEEMRGIEGGRNDSLDVISERRKKKKKKKEK